MDIMATGNVFIRHSRPDNPEGAVWFIHGFGESGAVFTGAFASGLADRFSLFAPDFPGFGASPFLPGSASIAASEQILERLIDKLSGDIPVLLVAHSLGGIIGTHTAARLGARMHAYINIEGNLTADDTFVTRLSAGFVDAAAFKRHLIDLFLPRIADDEVLRAWFAELSAAHPEALLVWAKDCVAATGERTAAEEYRALGCRTLYLWGEKSIPKRSLDFLTDTNLAHRGFAGCGHVPMLERPGECWEAVLEFFDDTK